MKNPSIRLKIISKFGTTLFFNTKLSKDHLPNSILPTMTGSKSCSQRISDYQLDMK